MNILIYWSESNSLIYFYIVLKKIGKLISPIKILLVLGRGSVLIVRTDITRLDIYSKE